MEDELNNVLSSLYRWGEVLEQEIEWGKVEAETDNAINELIKKLQILLPVESTK